MKHNNEHYKKRRIDPGKERIGRNEAAADKIASGQPLPVRHHPKQRQRKNRRRIHATISKGRTAQDKAEYYREQVNAMENNTVISSDDPQVIEKLTAKLAIWKQMQDFMKAANKCIKKKDKEKFLLLDFGTEALWESLQKPSCSGGIGYPQHKLTNNNAMIRCMQDRIEALQHAATCITTGPFLIHTLPFDNILKLEPMRFEATRAEEQAPLPTDTETAPENNESPVKSDTDSLRSALLALAVGTDPLTIDQVLDVLGSTYPFTRRTRTMGAAPCGYESRKGPRPQLILAGQYMEDAGMRIGKKVTVRIAPNAVLITVDDPGPDPAIDERYTEIQQGRQVMSDVYDKLFYGLPLRDIQEYAARIKEEREQQE